MIESVQSELLSSLGFLRFAMSTRQGGVSPELYGMNLSYSVGDVDDNVRENRRRFFQHVGVHQDRLLLPKQCHSARVVKVERGGQYEACDGLVSATPGVWLGISIADCVPIVLADSQHKAIAALHAGWRGTVQGIVGNGIRLMRETFGTNPKDLAVFIGPSASVCCYKVGGEVAERFSSEVLNQTNGSIFLDLKKENKNQLMSAGVPETRIQVSPHCTICKPETYHSFRRDKNKSGRMLAVVGILS